MLTKENKIGSLLWSQHFLASAAPQAEIYDIAPLLAVHFSHKSLPIILTTKTGLPSKTTRQTAPSKQMELYLRYHMRVILVLRILRWSWKMPYMSASLVGGHPGT